MMKKIEHVLLTVCACLLFAGCPEVKVDGGSSGTETNSESGADSGDTGSSSGTEAGGNTETTWSNNLIEIKGGTIVGADYINNHTGVFPTGRTVTLSDFYMSKYEITQAEYKEVMENQKVTIDGTEYTLAAEPSYCSAGSTDNALDIASLGEKQENRPVENVTWYDAVYYCNARSKAEKLTEVYNITVKTVEENHITKATVTLVEGANGYRLPTEAEWEYAARGGDPTAEDWNYTFSGADTATNTSYHSERNSGLDAVGWYCYNNDTGTTGESDVTVYARGRGTHEVGKKAANRLGIYDMCGNVLEWCYDWKGKIRNETVIDPVASVSDYNFVYRGGSWQTVAASALSVSKRRGDRPYYRSDYIGFRVVRSAK